MRKSRIRRLERALAQEDSGRREFLEMIDRIVEEQGLEAFGLPKGKAEIVEDDDEDEGTAGEGAMVTPTDIERYPGSS